MKTNDKLLIAGFAIIPLILGFLLGIRWCKFDPVTTKEYIIEEQICTALESAHSIIDNYLLQCDDCSEDMYTFFSASDSLAKIYNW